MKKVKVRMSVSIASADWSFVPKQEVDLELELAQKWHEVGHCVIIGEPYEVAEELQEPLTLEEFSELKADEQKALLKQLGIEGDDSNAEKRVALYAEFLGVEDPDGNKENNGPNEAGDPDAQTGDTTDSGTGDTE